MHEFEHNGTHHAAVEPASAADDEDQHHVGGAVELKHIQRRKPGGLRQQCPRRARHRGGHGVAHGDTGGHGDTNG